MLLQEGKDQCPANCYPEVDSIVQKFKYVIKAWLWVAELDVLPQLVDLSAYATTDLLV